jgi:hypothetical protein
MTREDFTFNASSTGYMILYKGKPIGGASSLPSSKKKHWRHAQADVKMHTETAKLTIRLLLAGEGYKFMTDAMKVIDRG